MAGHARISPSSLSRIMSCPASVKMSEGYPDTESPAALEGTLAHEALEKCLLAGDDSDNAYLQEVIDYVIQRQDDGLQSLLVEQRVTPKMIGRQDLYGTADIIVHDWDLEEVEVIDLKYGKGVTVEVANNYQLIVYALGAVSLLGADSVKKITVTIAQPRIEHPDGTIRSVVFTMDELDKYAQEIKERLVLVDADEPTYGPSKSACHWCKAKRDCKERSSHNLKELGLSFGPVDASKLEAIDKITEDERVQILDNIDMIRAWMSDIEEGAVNQIKSGKSVAGFKLVHGRANRRWIEDEDATKNALKSLGLKVKDYTTSKLSTPAAVEKAVKGDLSPAKVTKLKALVEKPQGKLTLAHETDRRPAAIMTLPSNPFGAVASTTADELSSLLS